MKFINSDHPLPIYSWCEPVEPGALQQAFNLADHPALFHHVALMPDCHQGYGMPIGGVIASSRVVIPNAVGVDIGCGMAAVKTSLDGLSVESLKKIMGKVRERIPLGFKRRKNKVATEMMPPFDDAIPMPIVKREFEDARTQLGTLGGGNHFIEVQRDSRGIIWLMIHSGSRNIGKQVADHYNRIAVALNEKQPKPLPKAWQLAGLSIDDKECRSYLAEMQYCVEFAYANRKYMMEILMGIVGEEWGRDIAFEPMINIAHNYASMEHHFGREVWVHRKGATLARKETVGIVPGSQGSKSYIVRGKGNPDSFGSCSHGAGRRLGRKEAQRTLDLQEEIRKLSSQGILHGLRGKGDLDEASGAYKDISDVMASQADLVDIVEELQPLGVVKG